MIYSPKEARRLSKEYKYVKASLQRVEDDINAYLRTVAGKLKLFNEVRNRMQVIEENQVKVQDEYQNIFKSFQKAESKYEDMKSRVNHFENGHSYNLHKFRSKEEAYKRLNLAREKFEEEKPRYENIEKAKAITQDQSTWSRKEWTREQELTSSISTKSRKPKSCS